MSKDTGGPAFPHTHSHKIARLKATGAAYLRMGQLPNRHISTTVEYVEARYWWAAMDCFNEAKRLELEEIK